MKKQLIDKKKIINAWMKRHPNLFKPKRCFHNGGSAFFVKEDLFWGRKIISLVAVGKPMILAELISVTVGARGKIYA